MTKIKKIVFLIIVITILSVIVNKVSLAESVYGNDGREEYSMYNCTIGSWLRLTSNNVARKYNNIYCAEPGGELRSDTWYVKSKIVIDRRKCENLR